MGTGQATGENRAVEAAQEVADRFVEAGVQVDLGSDQTSLHNPFAGGYYPVGIGFEEANRMMAEDPDQFRQDPDFF